MNLMCTQLLHTMCHVIPGGWEESLGVDVGSSLIKGSRMKFLCNLIEDVQTRFKGTEWDGSANLEDWVEASSCSCERVFSYVTATDFGQTTERMCETLWVRCNTLYTGKKAPIYSFIYPPMCSQKKQPKNFSSQNFMKSGTPRFLNVPNAMETSVFDGFNFLFLAAYVQPIGSLSLLCISSLQPAGRIEPPARLHAARARLHGAAKTAARFGCTMQPIGCTMQPLFWLLFFASGCTWLRWSYRQLKMQPKSWLSAAGPAGR